MILLLIGPVGIGLIVLDIIAVVKIITKAGYSGAWILVVFAPILVWAITSAVVYNNYDSTPYYGTFDAASFAWAWIADGIAYLVPWVFFLVFAFSDWPINKRLRALSSAGANPPRLPFPQYPPQSTQAGVMTSPAPQSDTVERFSAQAPTGDGHAVATSSVQFCRSCGSAMAQESAFCGACGTPLEH